jgi:hypothetical protein
MDLTNDIFCPICWEYDKKKIMHFDPQDNYYKCGNRHRLTQEQIQELDSKYKVIQFPKDEFTNIPKRLSD